MSAAQPSTGIHDRIPVQFGCVEEAGADDALLIQGDVSAQAAAVVGRFVLTGSPHQIGCACCAVRGPVSTALSRLFLGRARGETVYFGRVVVAVQDQAGIDAVRQAMELDVMVRARFRLIE